MPPYDLLAIQHLIFMVGVGLAIVFVVILARGSRWLSFSTQKKTDADREHDVVEFGGEVSETRRPVPWLIWLLWPAYFLWAAGYLIFNGMTGM
ncbi:MAG TPA: hypothetical protein VJ801_01835 [Polyangia bacterium]|jgi:4-hydroxybenzoate polyprenyltransferase|nr:hypothetical protein [Polyangia bacterium]